MPPAPSTSKADSTYTKKTPSVGCWFVFPAILITACWVCLASFGLSALLGKNISSIEKKDFLNLPIDHLGQTGDLFGALNALVTGLVLAGAIYAAVTQRHQLLMATHHFEEECRQNDLDRKEEQKQFALQIQFHEAQLKQAKEQAADEKAREAIELRRHKLEELLLGLDKIRAYLIHSNRDVVFDSKINIHTALETVLSNLAPLFSHPHLLAKVYFPNYIEVLTVPEPIAPYTVNPQQWILMESENPTLLRENFEHNRIHLHNMNEELGVKLANCYNAGIARFDEIVNCSHVEK